MASTELEVHLESMSSELNEAPREMTIFSLSMRGLFSSCAVGGDCTRAGRFRELRDDTRSSAVVYVKCVLPLVKQCVLDIKEYFGYFQDLTMDEWWDSIDDVEKEMNDYKKTCTFLIDIHKEIVTDLKKKQGDASVLSEEMKASSKVYERIAEDFKERADKKYAWATGLLFFPVVNVIATPLLRYSANNDLAESFANARQADIQLASARVVKDTLVPTIAKFVNFLQTIYGFFEVAEGQLGTIQSKGKKAKNAKEPKTVHYRKMKTYFLEIMNDCTGFIESLPAICSDLDAIPTNCGDQNYVDRWLERQKKAIRHKFSNESLVVRIVTAISGNTIQSIDDLDGERHVQETNF